MKVTVKEIIKNLECGQEIFEAFSSIAEGKATKAVERVFEIVCSYDEEGLLNLIDRKERLSSSDCKTDIEKLLSLCYIGLYF